MEPYRKDALEPSMRASDQERDAVAQRLQAAFSEGRLEDQEFDDRMRAALAARTHADLDELVADVPSTTPPAPRPVMEKPGPKPGRFAVAFKNRLERGGRWRVPERFRTLIYKGGCRVDLRAAELTAAVTTIVVVAYKSDVEIVVPPGVRVEAGGLAVSRAGEETEPTPPEDAPVVHVKGYAYKGEVAVRSMPSAYSR